MVRRKKKVEEVVEELVEEPVEETSVVEEIEEPEAEAFTVSDVVSEDEDVFSTLALPASSPDSRLDVFNPQSVYWRGKAIDEGIV